MIPSVGLIDTLHTEQVPEPVTICFSFFVASHTVHLYQWLSASEAGSVVTVCQSCSWLWGSLPSLHAVIVQMSISIKAITVKSLLFIRSSPQNKHS